MRRYLAKVGTPVPQKTIWADLQDTGVFRSHTHFKRKVLASMKARGEVCSDALCINCVCVCLGLPSKMSVGDPMDLTRPRACRGVCACSSSKSW